MALTGGRRKTALVNRCFLILFLTAALPAVLRAQAQFQPLPAPQFNAGKSLWQTLQERQSRREFRTNTVPLQTLANVLWAGFGTNRTDGRRTAPSTMNAQVLDLYVVTAEGTTRYDAARHALVPVVSGDLRGKTGGQDYVKSAPVAILLVADLSRMDKARPEDRERYAAIDAGCVTQNLYLACAAEGLATVVHEMDRRELPGLLALKPEQRLMLAQSIGLPK